jgi:hypothetical protein
MPILTRWTIRIALVYLVLGLFAGVLYWANTQWPFWDALAALSPTYLHMLVIGWVTQLIYGVMYWMFPIIRKDNMRGDVRLAWSMVVLLNVGLLLRVICEPWRALEANSVNGGCLFISAVLQTVAAYLFVLVCWPRVREKAGIG